jgi:hypothetical protein
MAPGPRDDHRQRPREVLAVCDKAEQIVETITASVELADGEKVDVVQQRELHPGKKVFIS